MSTTIEAAFAATILQMMRTSFVIELQPHTVSNKWHVSIRRIGMLNAETMIATGTATALLGAFAGAIERAQSNPQYSIETNDLEPLSSELSVAWSELASIASEQGWLRISGGRTSGQIRTEVEGLAVSSTSKAADWCHAVATLGELIAARDARPDPIAGEFVSR